MASDWEESEVLHTRVGTMELRQFTFDNSFFYKQDYLTIEMNELIIIWFQIEERYSHAQIHR